MPHGARPLLKTASRLDHPEDLSARRPRAKSREGKLDFASPLAARRCVENGPQGFQCMRCVTLVRHKFNPCDAPEIIEEVGVTVARARNAEGST